MSKNDITAILALRKIKGIGAVAIKSLQQKGLFQNQSYYKTIEKSLEQVNKEINDSELELYINEAQHLLTNCAEDNIKILDISDPRYPTQLLQLSDPPSILFYKGNLDLLNKVVGIIGTREPDQTGIEIARRIALYFHENGFSICNGLALGIDESSIKTKNGVLPNVVGVLAGGLNYNKSKTLLKSTAMVAEQVLEAGGLLMSEYESSVKEDAFKAIKSCKIQAGLSHGLTLIQSKLGGGSKYTLEAFCSLERPLGVISVIDKKDDSLYEANKAILEDEKLGLSKITGLKPDKIKIRKVPISNKLDYSMFKEAIDKGLHPANNNSLSLF